MGDNQTVELGRRDSLSKLGMADRQGIARSESHRVILDRLLLAVGVNGVEKAHQLGESGRFFGIRRAGRCERLESLVRSSGGRADRLGRRQRGFEAAGQVLQRRYELGAGLFKRQPIVNDRRRRRERAADFLDRLLEVWIVLRQRERAFVETERRTQLAAPMVDLGDPADRREVFGCAFEDVFELGLRRVELVHLEQRSPERHTRGEITRMDREPRAACGDRVFVVPGPPELFGKLSKSNRRRVLLDPASKLLDAGIVRHSPVSDRYGVIVRSCVVVAVLPLLSVTVRRTVYVNGAVNVVVAAGVVDVTVAVVQVVPAVHPKSHT